MSLTALTRLRASILPLWLGIRSSWVVALVLFALAWRAYSAVLAFYTNVVFPSYRPAPFTIAPRTHFFWDPFARYDSGWYYGIARYGYQFVEGGRSNLAYFPVYPTLMGWVAPGFGDTPASYYLAGIAVSWTAFAAAMVVLYRLARLDLPESQAVRAVVYAALFPFAFFFGIVYPESTFLLFSLLSFYWLRQRRWVAGGVAGGLMTATRSNAAAGVLGLVWLARRSLAGTPRPFLRTLGCVALVLSGVGAYSAYVYWLSGSPFAWVESINRWNYYPASHAPWTSLAQLVRNLWSQPYEYLTAARSAPYDTLNGLAAMVFTALVPLVWKRFGASYGLYMAAHLAVPLSSGEYEGLGRYCSVLFPAFLYLASLESRMLALAIPVGFATLYTLCLGLFANIHPLF